MLCQEGIECPKQLHGKVMEANGTLRNGFFLSLLQKASAGDCQCHEHNMFCFLVPCFFCTSPVPQGKDKWGGGIAVSKRATRVTELWTGNLNTSWWAPSTMWCCTGGQPQQKGSDLMIYRQLNYHYASTIPFALCLGQKHATYITHSPFPWNWI